MSYATFSNVKYTIALPKLVVALALTMGNVNKSFIAFCVSARICRGTKVGNTNMAFLFSERV